MRSSLSRRSALLVALTITACTDDALGRSRAQIATTPTAVDFGEVGEGASATQTLTITNAGGAALQLTRTALVDDARGALSAAPPALTEVPAGGQTTLVLTYRGAPAGVLDNARLVIESTADNAPVLSVPVTGRGPRAPGADGGAPDATPGPGPDAASPDATTPDSGEADAGVSMAGTWRVGPFGPCSTTCGTGTRTRVVECVGPGDGRLPDSSCTDPRPDDSEACTDNSMCACSSPACPGNVCSFTTAGEHVLAVPPGCSRVQVRAWGGGGAGGNQLAATGGGGAFATARFTVSPQGEALAVWVAQGGPNPGDGAGASYVLRGTTPLVVAGGGGGGGSDGCSGCASGGAGGAGGGPVGEDGQALITASAPYCLSATGGAGATTNQGGAGGLWTGSAAFRCNGEAGGPDTGGSANGALNGGACYLTRAQRWQAGGGQGNGGGGGGGAGHFGGGGAGFIWTYCAGGGGGGSSYTDVASQDVRLEAGRRLLQGNLAESQGAGSGGMRNGPGADGRVEVVLEP